MTTRILPPAPRPCGSCPYRCDVPSGVWDEAEYAKLPGYDGETFEQPPRIFLCHQQDGRLCAGWTAVHDMDESLGLRVATIQGMIEPDDLDEIRKYETDVPLWPSGAKAAEHGLQDYLIPSATARRVVQKLNRKQKRQT